MRMSYRINRILPAVGVARIVRAEGVSPDGLVEVLETRPDAVCLSPREAPWLQGRRDRTKPGLLLRADTDPLESLGSPEWPLGLVRTDAVELAVHWDAAGVLVHLTVVRTRHDVGARSGERIARLAAESARVSMPLFVRILAMRPVRARGYGVDEDAGLLCAMARQAVELGAEGIVVPWTTPEAWPSLVEAAAGRPVLLEVPGGAAERWLARAGAIGAAGVVERAVRRLDAVQGSLGSH